MIVYSATKAQFNNDVNLNRISDKILEKLREKHLSGGQESEYQSWQNSLHFMRSAIDDPDIPNDVEVAIEYQIPRTSKRVVLPEDILVIQSGCISEERRREEFWDSFYEMGRED